MRGIRLTKLQAEMLIDRLTLPECICEALVDDEDDDVARWADRPTEVAAFCLKVEARLECSRFLDASLYSSKWERAILADAVEGATYLYRMEDAFADGDISSAKLGGYRRAARGLSEKLNSVGIVNSGMPAT